MAHKGKKPCIKPARQGGATLLIGVIFLVILTLLGISAATISTRDERMAGNLRDRNVAFQAAEAALRDARRDILSYRKLKGYTGFSPDVGDCSTGEFIGLCRPATEGQQVWEAFLTDEAKSVAYGSQTNLSDGFEASVSKQPRYVVEVLPDPNTKESLKVGSTIKVVYRITSIGYGANEGTRVFLQEVIRP